MELPFDNTLPYEEPLSRQRLLKHLAILLNTGENDVKIKAFATSKQLEGILGHEIYGVFTLTYSQNGVSSFQFRLQKRGAKSENYRCDFLVMRQPKLPNIVLIISDCDRSTFKRLCQYLKGNTGAVAELGFDQAGFRELIINFRDFLKGLEIKASKVVKRPYAYRKRDDKPDTAEITWGSCEIEEVFDRARDLNWWFKSISYILETPGSLMRPVRGSVTRDGFFFITGMFNTVYEGLVSPYCRKLQSRFEFLQNRARLKEEGFQTKPIRLDFYEDFFEMPACNNDVIEMFHSYRNASVSVLHGNPYIHLSVVDFQDGSSYDILIVDKQSITIVPQLRATPRALHRVCEYIWDNFNEGTLCG